ncbi:MAG: hypothetical protein AABX11_00015 [Nanoarchaeota archaeon]
MGFNKGLIFVGVVVMIVLVAVFLVVPPKFSPASGSGQIPCGNSGLMYDPGKEKCCLDTQGVGATQTPRTSECCGNNPIKFYDPGKEKCCVDLYGNGTIQAPNTLACCGNIQPQAYDPESQTCCEVRDNGNSYINEVWNGSGLSCCGTVGYDSTEESCCMTNTGGFTQAPAGLSCCGNYSALSLNDIFYDPLVRTCCTDNKGIGYTKYPTGLSCCGDIYPVQFYDLSEYNCRKDSTGNGTLIPIEN